MFLLVEMSDTVRIPPWNFGVKLNEAVTSELNKKLANKVVYNVGLCVCLYDITKMEDSFVFPGDGASHTKVHFRFVVFRPFLDEILIGKIKCCSQEGVQVSLGFFDDIRIPPESLQQPSKLLLAHELVLADLGIVTQSLRDINKNKLHPITSPHSTDDGEQVWVWEYETEEGTHDLFMDVGEDVRFRVMDETFVDTTPSGPEAAGDGTAAAAMPGSGAASVPAEDFQKKQAPYSLTASISEPGLGLLSWWNNS